MWGRPAACYLGLAVPAGLTAPRDGVVHDVVCHEEERLQLHRHVQALMRRCSQAGMAKLQTLHQCEPAMAQLATRRKLVFMLTHSMHQPRMLACCASSADTSCARQHAMASICTVGH